MRQAVASIEQPLPRRAAVPAGDERGERDCPGAAPLAPTDDETAEAAMAQTRT